MLAWKSKWISRCHTGGKFEEALKPGIHFGFETHRRRHQKFKTGVSVTSQKGLMSSQKKPNDFVWYTSSTTADNTSFNVLLRMAGNCSFNNIAIRYLLYCHSLVVQCQDSSCTQEVSVDLDGKIVLRWLYILDFQILLFGNQMKWQCSYVDIT